MNFNTLVETIAAKVMAQVELAEKAVEISAIQSVKTPRPRLLVLTQEHGACCHETLESSRLAEKFAIDCALLKNYDCDVNDYEALLIYHLNNSALSRVAVGMCDIPYAALIVQAILAGRKIYVIRNEVELFDYSGTAPAVYYNMMLQKVKLLEDSGVIFCDNSRIEDAILENTGCTLEPGCLACKKEAKKEKQLQLKKKVITEKDLTAAHAGGITLLQIGTKSILTDLARDYAHERGIAIVRE